MKKVLLLVLTCLGVLNANAQYSDKTKEIVATLGVPFTITPYIDLGIPVSDFHEWYGREAPAYNVSDAAAFSIISKVVIVRKDGNGYSRNVAYTYTMTPQKTGFYTFSQGVVYWSNHDYRNIESTMTYNITVVDLTAINLGTNSLSMYLGENYQFNPTLTHPKAQTTLTWQSSNTSVATVDANASARGNGQPGECNK